MKGSEGWGLMKGLRNFRFRLVTLKGVILKDGLIAESSITEGCIKGRMKSCPTLESRVTSAWNGAYQKLYTSTKG